MSKTKFYLSNIDKDVRRILGKRLYGVCEELNGGWIYVIRSNGDIEYHLNGRADIKLKRYMREHKRSRLYKAWTGCKNGYNLRFEVEDGLY